MNSIHQLLPRLSQSIRSVGSDRPSSFGGDFEGGYLIQQCSDEFSRLVCLLAAYSPFATYLEIGIAAGGSIRFLNESIQIDRNIVMDDGKHAHFPVWKSQNRNYVPNVTEFIGDSHSEEAAGFLRELRLTFPLVGIDGDHTYDGVSADWRLVEPYVSAGSLIWFHDIRACEGVAKLWHELRSIHLPLLETNQLGIGVLQVKTY